MARTVFHGSPARQTAVGMSSCSSVPYFVVGSMRQIKDEQELIPTGSRS
jgi:hypothetical protein